MSKADLEDGFARISVTLLHAWALLKLSDCAKSCLMILVADTWAVGVRKPGYMSSLNRYALSKKLKLTFGRTSVYESVEKLKKADVVIQDQDGLLGINPDVLSSHSHELTDEVKHLNLTRRSVLYSGKPDVPEKQYSGLPDNDCGTPEHDPPDYSGTPHGKSGKPYVNSGKPEQYPSTDARARRDLDDESIIRPKGKADFRDLPDADLIDIINRLATEFVPLVHKATMKPKDQILAELKSIRLPKAKFVEGLAIALVLARHGTMPKSSLPGMIANAGNTPQNYPPVDPLKLLAEIDSAKTEQAERQKRSDATHQAYLEKRKLERIERAKAREAVENSEPEKKLSE
ncbi:MAG: hypothetical protein V3V10_07240 [Planctomycetota bacterium]